MTSTASAPLRSVAPAPATALGTHPAGPTPSCVVEVEAWLLEVAPVVAALRQAPTSPSPGQQRWLVRLADDALRAQDLLDHECLEAEAAGEPAELVEWLHTRVSATLDGARALLVDQLAAA